MATGLPESLERRAPADLIGVVRDLIGEVGRLRAESEKLGGALAKLKVEHQAVNLQTGGARREGSGSV
jgi:hypothetical protein